MGKGSKQAAPAPAAPEVIQPTIQNKGSPDEPVDAGVVRRAQDNSTDQTSSLLAADDEEKKRAALAAGTY